MSHKVQTVVKLLALGCAQTDIYGTRTDIYGAWIDTHATQTDTHAAQMDTYALMSDKYITSLLLIKILKAFIRVNIKSHLLTYVFLLTLLQVQQQ